MHREAQVPYLYKDKLWVTYEDEESAMAKSTWIKKMDFGGAMVFDINEDDVNGQFSKVKFPIIRTIANVLIGKPVTLI